jgi:hypothetical protein
MMNCRENNIAASRAASAALGYQSMLKQWISEKLEQELRDRGGR